MSASAETPRSETPSSTAKPTTCAYDIHGDWSHIRRLCGKPAKWRDTYTVRSFGKPDATETRDLCGLHASMIRRSRYYRTFHVITPIAPNGCPVCATPMTGTAPTRLCPNTKKCGYDEAAYLISQATIERAEQERRARVEALPFTEAEVEPILMEISRALDTFQRALVPAFNRGEVQADLGELRAKLRAAVLKLDVVHIPLPPSGVPTTTEVA